MSEPLKEAQIPRRSVPSPLLGNTPAPRLVANTNNWYAWMLGFLPLWGTLLLLLVSALTRDSELAFWPVIAFIALSNCALVICDLALIKKAGYNTKSLALWGLFLIPLYLFLRAKKLKQSSAYGWVWVGLGVLFLVLSTLAHI